ncbi:MAG: hypothetical protein D3913_04395 [Candidatus Electrothrix sp. LOE1_4_5]|nr:hypothetical protein [Candidatus Electrothrix gigas]
MELKNISGSTQKGYTQIIKEGDTKNRRPQNFGRKNTIQAEVRNWRIDGIREDKESTCLTIRINSVTILFVIYTLFLLQFLQTRVL